MTSPRFTFDSARRRELACLLALVAIFLCFTWRGLTMFFSDDDVMNMYKAWATPALDIWKAQLLPWVPLARPLGAAIYRLVYAVFGFHPLPLYLFWWLLLAGNVFVAWRLFRAVLPSVFTALIALSLTLVHGSFQELYLNAGTCYDGLCFAFTALAVILYARMRREGAGLSAVNVALLCAVCLLAMNSKESGAVVPAILFGYECIYVLPSAWRGKKLGAWLRAVAPFYVLMGGVVLAYVIGRVRRAEGVAGNPDYQAHYDAAIWAANVAGYLNMLSYRYLHLSAAGAAIVLVAMLVLAIMMRNRAMIFGWLYFVLAITPVALIAVRGGYVIYVPYAGLGIYFAALLAVRGEFSLRQTGVIVAVTALMTLVHVSLWPAPWVASESPEWRLADTMRRHYPTMRPAAKILFADDLRFDNGYDPLFNLRLLYGDPLIEIARLKGPAGQQPDPARLQEFDHVYTTASGNYFELDRRDVPESIRLNILKDYPAGRNFNTARDDAPGYVISGITTGRHGEGWWSARSAKLKFDVPAADSHLSLKYWVPDFVAKGGARTLTVMVNEETVGTIALNHAEENTAEFPVPARVIHSPGFTIVSLEVDDPWRENGQEYGVLVLEAGFSTQ